MPYPAQYAANVAFTLTDITSFQPYLPQLYNNSGWEDIPNLPKCANMSLWESSGIVGFFYSQRRKVCTPITGFGELGTAGVRELNESDGSLYLFNRPCPTQFKFYIVDGSTTCLRISTHKSRYEEATAICESWGGHLATIKTEAKRQLVYDLGGRVGLLIGLDDVMKEGRLVWQEDGAEVTSYVTKILFDRVWPTDDEDSRDCVVINWATGLLKTYLCDNESFFACETKAFET